MKDLIMFPEDSVSVSKNAPLVLGRKESSSQCCFCIFQADIPEDSRLFTFLNGGGSLTTVFCGPISVPGTVAALPCGP